MDVLQNIADGLYRNKVLTGPVSMSSSEADILAWRVGAREATERFKADLFEEFGIQDNPKREKCWEIAERNSGSLN